MKNHTLDEARSAKAHAREALGAVAPQASVGITRIGKGYGLKINLTEEPGEGAVPTEVDGVPVRVEVTGLAKKRAPGPR